MSVNQNNIGNIFSIGLNTVISDFNTANGYQANPTWSFPEPQTNIAAFQVDSFIMPNSIFTIDQRNDILYWKQYSGTTGTLLQATVPTNYYDSTTLATALQSTLNSYNTNGNYQVAITGAGNSYYTITNTTNNFVITGAETGVSNINYEIGFMSVTETPAHTQTGSQTFDVSGLKQLNIVSNNLGVSHTFTPGTGYKVLTNISVTAPFGGLITYNGDLAFSSCPTQYLPSFTVLLLDERMRSLQGSNVSDWSLTMYLRSM